MRFRRAVPVGEVCFGTAVSRGIILGTVYAAVHVREHTPYENMFAVPEPREGGPILLSMHPRGDGARH